MLDGSGKVRIMDFSLAATGAVTGVAGTPAYMAPEQLTGRDVTARSDIYALGLVLYELFTGKRVYQTTSIPDLLAQHSSGSITAPTEIVRTLDGAIERAILRCLDPEPARRPLSPLAVAASLPGGDPLAAALAAGETPSPEMVAAAGGEAATMSPVAAAVWLGLAAVLLLSVAWLADRTSLLSRVPLTKPMAVLEDRAEELRQALGYNETPVDQSAGFEYDQTYLVWARREGRGGDDARKALASGRPGALYFWRRTSPVPLVPWHPLSSADLRDPPLDVAGTTAMTLDTAGTLIAFTAVPPQLESTPTKDAAAPQPMNWAPLFAAAKLDQSTFTEVAPSRTPPHFADERRAWRGTLPETGTAVTIEAAAYRNRVVAFEIVAPWTAATRESGQERRDVSAPLQTVLILTLLATAAVLARRNLRSGRADRRGAFRLAAVFFFIYVTFWVLAPHVSILGNESERLFMFLGIGLFVGGVMYLVYLAIEPFVRRSWPTMLVGWSRALAGRLPDPIVGRDLAVGVVSGLALACIVMAGLWAPEVFGWVRGMAPATPSTGPIEHMRYLLLLLPNSLNSGLQNALLSVMAFTGFRELIKRILQKATARMISPDVVAAILALAFLMLLNLAESDVDGDQLWLVLLLQFASSGLFLLVLFRYGLFATAVMYFIATLAQRVPLTLQPASLYAGSGWTMMGFMLAMGLAGIWMARRNTATVNFEPGTRN